MRGWRGSLVLLLGICAPGQFAHAEPPRPGQAEYDAPAPFMPGQPPMGAEPAAAPPAPLATPRDPYRPEPGPGPSFPIPGPGEGHLPPPGHRRHDGFFARATVGLGGIRLSSSDDADPDFELSGLGTVGSLAVGGAVTDNLIIAGEFLFGAVVNPKLTVEGSPRGAARAELNVAGLGAGVTYYLMPVNLYLSATIGLGRARLVTDFDGGSTDTGVAVAVMVGKEWWLSSEWGMGAALQLTAMHLPNGDAPALGTGSLGLMFSATYN